MTEEVVLLFGVFIIFIAVAYKIFRLISKAFLIGLIAMFFPFVSNHFLGTNIDTSIYSMLWFALAGVGLFFVYSGLKTGGKFLKIATWPIRKILGLVFKRKGQ